MRGKPLAWDVTVPDTFADAHVINSAREAGVVAEHAATKKTNKYSCLTNTHIFYPVVIETAGMWHHQAIELVKPTLWRRARDCFFISAHFYFVAALQQHFASRFVYP